MLFPFTQGRRVFLRRGWAFLALSLTGCSPSIVSAKTEAADKIAEIMPTENLMREHGVPRRILLLYEEASRRLEAGQDLPIDSLAAASRIVRSFVEDYHEKLEEEFLFPRFRKAGRLVDLVNVLNQQHKAGRKLTDATLQLASAKTLKDPDLRHKLAVSLDQFIRMYRPHAAREDTTLFPALRGIVKPREFDAMGEEFEKREEDRYGYTGYYRIIDQVADLEQKFGIFDLAKFTPPAS